MAPSQGLDEIGSAAAPGARTPAEVRQNVTTLEHPIPADLWAELEHEGLVQGRADAVTVP
jgi:D-threo-aldose 1-dehydrogenase